MSVKNSVYLLALGIVLAFSLIASCDGGDNDKGVSSSFQLYLIDAPIDEADEVNLTVLAATVRGDGWTDLDIVPQRYNLLDLQNNAGVVLADQDLDVGDYSEVRLVIACEGVDAPDIVIDGTSRPLKVPSGCTSGFKLKGNFTIAENQPTVLIMDFDVRKSVHQTGDGKYILNPVVRLIQGDAAGSISGVISPAVPRAVVYAYEAGQFAQSSFEEAANSTIVRDDGSFTLAALPAGLYDLVVAASGYETKVYEEDVEVTGGEETVLEDPIELTPAP